MVDWFRYLEALGHEGGASRSSDSPADSFGQGALSNPQVSAESLFLEKFLQLLKDFVSQSATDQDLPANGAEREAAVIAAGRVIADEVRRSGLVLSACLNGHSRIRDRLLVLAERLFTAEELDECRAELLRFSDNLLVGLVEEWSRLKSQTHRRRHLEARRFILQEKKRYAAIFRRMAEPAFVVDGELRLIDANPAFDKFFGWSAREYLGTTCMEAIGHKFCGQCPLPGIVREGGSFSNVEIELEVACGGKPGRREPRTVLLGATSLNEGSTSGAGAIVVLQNVTEQKRAEIELRRSEEKFRTLVENLPDVVWLADREGRILYVTANAAAVMGLAADELQGEDRFARVHPDDLPGLHHAYALLFEKGQDYDERYRFRHRNGNWIWLRERASASLERQGMVGAQGLCWDITEIVDVEEELEEYRSWLEDMVDERTEELSKINRKLKKEIAARRRVEKELIRMTASLQHSNAELEQFAYVASHDLKEPLMLITAFAERLQQRYGRMLDERGRDYLARITKAAGKLQELIEALLQLSRVSTSQRPFERLELNQLISEMLGDLEECLRSTGARVELLDLPVVDGDEVQIRQLFQNLIANAIKYRRQEVMPEITISGHLPGDGTCEISIADNGIGLNVEDLERIFEPFVRAHDRESCNSCGMGLTTCRKIVARHGGEIRAVSRPGHGALFVIRLPLAIQANK